MESQVNQHKQAIDIYCELQEMKFGFKEIKQLWNSLLEIAEANNISYSEAVSKFLKDVDEQYDNKLGFESKVDEKRNELVLIHKELNNTRQILRFTPLLGPTLSNLFQKGIGEQDIIGINQLVEICTNNIDFSNSTIGTQKENITKDTNKDNIKSRSEYWKLLTRELKRYGDIKVAIKEQQENFYKLQEEVNELDTQKQQTSSYLQIAISFINTINNRIFYFKGIMDHFKYDINQINLSSGFSYPFIIIIYNNTGKDKDDNDNSESKECKDK